ncbi:MAG: glycosyltransferase family 4 protein [Alphaproteobacteria bacterium]|nr:glycosyltransferase family 4 protein [Alphaproteobacteria bacterium]
MRVAFYAPMKPPDHPVPSGDRHLARLFMAALRHAGHTPELISHFVTRDGHGDPVRQARLKSLGDKLAERLIRQLRTRPIEERPMAWMTYHLYHKTPDWLGPRIADTFNIPYLIAEASTAPKQAGGPWDIGYRGANAAIARADAILTLNSDDWDCLQPVAQEPVLHRRLLPFVEASIYDDAMSRRASLRAAHAKHGGWSNDTVLLLAVGMMRAGAKESSYAQLAEALKQLPGDNWHLLVAGDGPRRETIAQMLETAAPGRVTLLGVLESSELAKVYAASDMLIWPAVDEAFGIALLEAQAAGLPVIASKQRGVPDIVASGITGRLPPPDDIDAFAKAIGGLIDDPETRARMGSAAARRVREQYDIPVAAERLDATLKTVTMVVKST